MGVLIIGVDLTPTLLVIIVLFVFTLTIFFTDTLDIIFFLFITLGWNRDGLQMCRDELLLR